jgi:hypothetical protein
MEETPTHSLLNPFSGPLPSKHFCLVLVFRQTLWKGSSNSLNGEVQILNTVNHCLEEILSNVTDGKAEKYLVIYNIFT